MYKPRLKYVFCLMRKRSLWPAMSLMQYMNAVGIVPQLLINGTAFGADQHALIVQELNKYKVKYKEIKTLFNHDVLFSEGLGTFSSFEKSWLSISRKQGKKNVMLVNGLSGWMNDELPYFLPDKTALLDGICMKMEEQIRNFERFTKGLFFVNVGDPDWDWWKTDEFSREVAKAKAKLGPKSLVYCGIFSIPEQEIPYTNFCIKQAEKLGFKFIINPHPDRWYLMPKQFYKYCNMDIHHHVLFKAASHVISSITCSVITESLFLGTKVGCDGFIGHCAGHGKHKWLDRNSWLAKVSKNIKQEILNMTSLVSDEKSLSTFLSSSEPGASIKAAEKVFGKKYFPSYGRCLFETLDRKLGK